MSRNLELAELLRKIGRSHDRTPGEAAIAWVLHNSAVTAAIVGVRSADQVGGIAGALTFRLSDQEAAAIEGFLRQPAQAGQSA
ncbi:MAG: aldo/keto reductase [Bryobacteraceae bacterium]